MRKCDHIMQDMNIEKSDHRMEHRSIKKSKHTQHDRSKRKGDHTEQDDDDTNRDCVEGLSRSFLALSTGIHGLCGILLIFTGSWQISCTWNIEKQEADVHQLSTYQNLCYIIIISGVFLLLWTIVGWIVFIRKSIKLDITCGVSNFVLFMLFYFIICANPQHLEFYPENNRSFIVMFCISITSSFVHSLIFFAQCSKANRNEEFQDDNLRSEVPFYKTSPVMHKLAFSSDIYNC